MFIDRLNDGEKKVLIDLLMHIVKVDNKLSKREASYLLDICNKHNLVMNFSQESSIEDLCLSIKCTESRVIILQELIRAAKIDSDYCAEEEEFVKKIKILFEISFEKYQVLTKWVDSGVRWKEEGEKLLSS